ncbi:hypothetical protein PSTG_01339 [Puccinia striiformis f. sp. tritici PST-78]|uniref:Uncharacterized protein n=1 Tax=Puccinia striiformis f. sp. tritici PST-78 TaxID=1165861 RepID=A0A0L0W237_9BASI|nr:hypothetical protein PSTG_01339 [Puccinia striiformis f. sp. tritici PST-78]
MFLTKVIWKVYLASGYIALIYQPAIRISEARPNILVRRQVTQPPNPGYLPMTGVRQPTTNGTPSPGLSGNANPTIDSSSGGYTTPAAPGLSTTGTGTSLSGYSIPGTTNGNGGYTNPSTTYMTGGYGIPTSSSTFGRGTEASPTPGGAYIQSTPTSAPPGNVRAIGQNSTTPATPLNPSGTGGTGTSTSTTPATPQTKPADPPTKPADPPTKPAAPPVKPVVSPPKPKVGAIATEPIQCSSSYGATKFDPKQPPETISCRNSDQLGYYCPISKCLKGKAKDTADKAPFSKFTFKKCDRLAAADLPAKGNIPEIHIFQYWAHQDGTITVRGYEDDVSRDRHTYTCAAKSSNDNLVRPWCDACIFMDKPDEADPNPS